MLGIEALAFESLAVSKSIGHMLVEGGSLLFFFSLSYADLFHKSLYLVTCVHLATSFCFSNLIIHYYIVYPGIVFFMTLKKDIFFTYKADCWNDCVHTTIELKKVYRQKDPLFISILQNVRVGR